MRFCGSGPMSDCRGCEYWWHELGRGDIFIVSGAGFSVYKMDGAGKRWRYKKAAHIPASKANVFNEDLLAGPGYTAHMSYCPDGVVINPNDVTISFPLVPESSLVKVLEALANEEPLLEETNGGTQ